MKKKNNLKIISIVSIVTIMLLISCSPDTTPSLYSEKDGGATPVITSMEPAQGLAGVTEITISGENFSTEISNNFVYFGPLPATIISASENELRVLAPDLVKDSIQVKVAVSGVEKFSDFKLYNLDAAVSEVYPFLGFQQPYAVTSDELGNIYFSLTEAGAGKGVKKITPDGELVDFAPKGGETFYFGLKYKTGGILYGVRGVRAIFEITEGNAPKTYAVLDNGTSMFDLDFDKNGNIWTAGKGGKIYRVTPDKDIKSFEFADNVSSLRIFNDYLYLAVKSEISQDIIRLPIVSSDSLGAAEIYFPFSANYGFEILDMQAITFANDGQLYIGTDGLNPIIYVNADGTYGYWYENLVSPKIINFGWSTGVTLYAVREEFIGSGIETTQTIYTINMEKSGAPEFGRD